MSKPPCCGNCALFTRSPSPGLLTYGKCPHRPSWVRSHHAACEHHTTGRKNPALKGLMLASVAVALLGVAMAIYVDYRSGNAFTHVALGIGLLLVAIFLWFFRRMGADDEDVKYIIFEEPPEEDDPRDQDF